MSQDNDLQKLPEAVGYIPQIIAALRELNGVAKAAAVRDSIVGTMKANAQPINETLLKTGAPKYQNDIQWARMYLVNAELLEPVSIAGHGIWKLTDAGWSTPLDKKTIKDVYFQTTKKGSKPPADDQAAPTDEDQQHDLPGMDSWELQLKKILTTMPDKGFERLCAQVMTQNGLHATKVTGQSGDKGIDGEGFLAIDEAGLVSMRVAWQCKRYAEGKVASNEIRDFRGALDKDIAHGIIFTTSMFTTDAEQEAKQPGKTPIQLVNLERLIELLEKFGLGVKPVTTNAVDARFFEPYLQPVSDTSTGSLLT
jgi:restriction system protein